MPPQRGAASTVLLNPFERRQEGRYKFSTMQAAALQVVPHPSLRIEQALPQERVHLHLAFPASFLTDILSRPFGAELALRCAGRCWQQ
jgi:hypothetical protein